MKPITCLHVAVRFHIDRVVKECEPGMFLMNTRAIIEQRLKSLRILQLDGEMRGTHVLVHGCSIARRRCCRRRENAPKR
ncbi:hypothetical protein SAMN05421869_110122 [Nonomuraea jiangxiensis]|uniref:Uncharacterized protein n=1 Tax=Nonomuraea jiangxiensis TaxID=633440 RepID=A0A1G8TD19_9ACTN|nr:hypothetical protein SAMN05421869_110122 [Nonomuraea jiangxiensis]